MKKVIEEYCCDLCGKQYDPKTQQALANVSVHYGIRSFYRGQVAGNNSFELCSDCAVPILKTLKIIKD